MLSRLEYKVLGMPGIEYQLLFGTLVIAFIFLLYYAFIVARRYRIMDGTATSKIRSAAQGYVELKGVGEFMQGDSMQSPFSGRRCIWYHCTIDKRERGGKRTTWTNISDDCSSHLFRIVDDTGECIIDPDDAHVIPETDSTWFGQHADGRAEAPKVNRVISINSGNYRFRERLITPATTLYAMGRFKTIHSDLEDELISKQVEDLLRQWKLQPHCYLNEFDVDQDGKIRQGEWKTVRAAARKKVMASVYTQPREHNVLTRPEHGGQPYIISAQDEEILAARKKLKAYASVTLAFLIFGCLVTLFSIRTPLPI